MSALEDAAIAFVDLQLAVDRARYGRGPEEALRTAWRRLRVEAGRACVARGWPAPGEVAAQTPFISANGGNT